MKVLEPGRPQKGWAKEFNCTGNGNGMGGCSAKLLVEQGDLFKTHNSSLGESETFVTFECSECHVWTDINPEPPRHVTENLPSRTPNRGSRDARD